MNKSERQKAKEKAELFGKYGMAVPKLTEELKPESRLPEVACFAFDIDNGCTALIRTYCRYEKCDFYKNEKQFQREQAMRKARRACQT